MLYGLASADSLIVRSKTSAKGSTIVALILISASSVSNGSLMQWLPVDQIFCFSAEF